MNIYSTLTFSDRLSLTLGGLARLVAACSDRRRVGGALATWLINLVWTRVKRTEVRILALLTRFREGRLGGGVTRAGGGGVGAAGRSGGRGAVKGLPQGFAWLLPLIPGEAANFASQLRGLLAEPEMAGLLAASAQARRVLAPVCRMLGVEAAVLTPAPTREGRGAVGGCAADDLAPLRDDPGGGSAVPGAVAPVSRVRRRFLRR